MSLTFSGSLFLNSYEKNTIFATKKVD